MDRFPNAARSCPEGFLQSAYYISYEVLWAAPSLSSRILDACNIEFSCRPESTRYATVRLTAFVLNRLHPGGQLQRFVMNTIRVMAWLERANLTAHATRATHSESPRCQTASCGASPTASLQLRRSYPMPSRMTAASATRSNHNPSDGVAGTRQP